MRRTGNEYPSTSYREVMFPVNEGSRTEQQSMNREFAIEEKAGRFSVLCNCGVMLLHFNSYQYCFNFILRGIGGLSF